MELQFEKKQVSCLRRDAWEIQEREQTQEVRLTEGMPDIGSVVAARGQCVIRSKEWLGDSISASGGVMVWVLYAPADGSELRTIEEWVPIQGRWSIPQAQREGSIRCSMRLRGADARTTSPRKMMVRVNVSMLAEALEPWETEVCIPEEAPADVQLLRRTYPAILPQEAGEKAFLVEEDLEVPGAVKLVYYSMEPQVMEQKVIGGRAVFRGDARMHIVYEGEDGQLHGMDLEAPFSQFSELDRDYDKEATVDPMVAVTSLEPELQDGVLRLKCGLLVQYVVYDCVMLQIVEDAYSTSRAVLPKMQELELPMVLDRCKETVRCEAPVAGATGKLVDCWSCAGHPKLIRAGELAELEFGGTVGVIYRDEEGAMRSGTAPWSHTWELPVGEGSSMLGRVMELSKPIAASDGDGMTVKMELGALAQTVGRSAMPMVSALEIGEQMTADPDRPSLILRRMGEQSLWELAKNCGSTVDAICKANGLSAEPTDGRMLLIPVS